MSDRKLTLKYLSFLTLAVTAVVMLLSNSSVSARPLGLYLSGGISDPAGSLAEAMEVGYHVAAKLGLQLEPRTEFLFGGEFHSMPSDHNRLPEISTDFRTILVGFDVKINVGIPEDPIEPFLIVGGGYANIDFSDRVTAVGGVTADSDSHSYFELGGGFEIKRAFALVRFVNVFSNQSSGARFISIGIGYRLPLL